MLNDQLIIGQHTFTSRLFVGTGKFASNDLMIQSILATHSELVTVALRRVDLSNPQDDLWRCLHNQSFILMPNTSGAKNAEEAVRIARLARAAGATEWIKVEVTPEPRYLLPDPIETFKACEILVKDGFIVMPYINADPVLAKRLEEIGVASVMPLGAPIGSSRGIKTREQIQIIIEQSNIPVVVDAGLGSPSHAAEAMEMGADAVLINTAIAVANNPVQMADAFRLGVIAGRQAFLAGQSSTRFTAQPSSPIQGVF